MLDSLRMMGGGAVAGLIIGLLLGLSKPALVSIMVICGVARLGLDRG